MENAGISVVIPNYNGQHLFPETLPALLSALHNIGLDFEIIVSDDCSTDHSLCYLREKHPDIIIVESKINRGFSPTINSGIFRACKPLVLLLNSDVKLTPDYFKTLLTYFDKDDTFGVMGRIVGWQDDEIQDGAKFPERQGVKLKTSLNYIPEGVEPFLHSLYLSGANALVSREKLLLLNGFEELYAPFYIEDVDLSLRAWKNNWYCYYEHRAVCRHRTSTSIKSKEKKRYISTIYNRNKFYLHAIHLEANEIPIWILQTLAELFLRSLTFRFDFVKSFWLFLKNLKKVRQVRKANRTIPDGEKLSFSDILKKIRLSARPGKVIFFRR